MKTNFYLKRKIKDKETVIYLQLKFDDKRTKYYTGVSVLLKQWNE